MTHGLDLARFCPMVQEVAASSTHSGRSEPIFLQDLKCFFQTQTRRAPGWPGLFIFKTVARSLVLAAPGASKQNIRSLIYCGLVRSRAASDWRPMRGPNFPFAIFFDIHLRYARPVIAHCGTTFPSH